MHHKLLPALLLVIGFAPQLLAQQRLDEMSLDRWKKLREVERYQLQIAEKYYRESNWTVALSEYEKYLTLYERSEAASHAQLKWSVCQVNLRKGNTAIKEGFQSVIDYWPDSPDAIAAQYYMARTYKNIGEVATAKKFYRALLAKHKEHDAAGYAINDLIEVAVLEKDDKARVDLWKQLTFDIPRHRYNASICTKASQQLAAHYFTTVAFDDGVKSLATTYNETQIVSQVAAYARGPILALVADSETKQKGERLADLAIAYVRKQIQAVPAGENQQATARQYWLYVADLTAVAGRVDKVPGVYEQIIKSYDNDDDTLSRLAAWYKSQNRYDDARKTYRRYEDQVEGLGQVAYSHRQQNALDPAIMVYNELLRRDAEGLVRWKTQIAATYRSFKKYPEAIATYEQLLTDDLENSQSWRWQIASAYQDFGKYKEAIGHYRQCTNFPSNYQQMAWCHRRLKQYNEALALYGQIVAGSESSAPWALLQIGYTREEAGQKEQAIKTFQAVCKRFPKNQYASSAHAHLQSVYKITVTLGGAKDE